MRILSSSFVERGGIPSTMTVEVLPAAGVGTISSSDADTNDGSVGGLEDDSSGSTARGKPGVPPVKPVWETISS